MLIGDGSLLDANASLKLGNGLRIGGVLDRPHEAVDLRQPVLGHVEGFEGIALVLRTLDRLRFAELAHVGLRLHGAAVENLGRVVQGFAATRQAGVTAVADLVVDLLPVLRQIVAQLRIVENFAEIARARHRGVLLLQLLVLLHHLVVLRLPLRDSLDVVDRAGDIGGDGDGNLRARSAGECQGEGDKQESLFHGGYLVGYWCLDADTMALRRSWNTGSHTAGSSPTSDMTASSSSFMSELPERTASSSSKPARSSWPIADW